MPIAITEWIFWSTTEHHEQWGIQVVWETGLGTQTLASKKHSFFGSISTKNICWSRNQRFHNISNYDKHTDRRGKQWDKKLWSERRNSLRKCLHLFKYIIDIRNYSLFSSWFFYQPAPISKLHKEFTFLRVILSVLLAVSFKLRLLQAYSHTNFSFRYINFSKIIHEEEHFIM